MAAEQSFKNHTRWDPIFHFIIMPALVLNVVVASVWYHHHYYQHVHSGAWVVFMTIILLLVAEKARSNALKVQDRTIRLEEKLRLAALCTPEQLAEFDSLTTKQYVALRFASNPELLDLARRAVREHLDGKAIKAAIKSWRPDHDRV
jgi:hypothetical protein